MLDERHYSPLAGETDEAAKRMAMANEAAPGADEESKKFVEQAEQDLLANITEEDKDRMMKQKPAPETNH